MDRIDRLFQDQSSNACDFTFDSSVAAVFDDMLSRSVPFYHELQNCLSELARAFAVPHSAVYDLGCSTGTTLKMLVQAIPDPAVRLVGYDNSQPMLDQASVKLADHLDRIELRLVNIDTEEVLLADASVVMMNWTLQFIRPIHREALLRHIYASLRPGGCLLVCEKVLAENSMLSRLYIDLYHAFKRRHSYSESEISRKREALENVLVPYRVDEDLLMLRQAGFTLCDVFFRWYNWAGFIAVKQ